MRAVPFLLVGLLSPAAAWAVDHELSVELGTQAVTDPSYNTFSSANALPSWGLRGGYALSERIAVIGSWHHSRRGLQGSGDGTFSQDYASALYAESIAVGVKADLEVLSWLRPYAIAQGRLWVAEARLDDEPEALHL